MTHPLHGGSRGSSAGLLLVAAVALAACGCESVRRDLTPMKEADAVRRYEQDPQRQPREVNPWERQREDQERFWREQFREARR